MHIGIDGSRAEARVKTGVEYYSQYLLHELRHIIPPEHGVTVYTRSGEFQKKFGRLPGHWKEKILPWPLPYAWTYGRLSWEMLTAPPDVLMVPSHVLPLRRPARCVTTIHDCAFEFLPDLYSRADRVLLHYGLTRALKQATDILVPSHHVKQTLLDLFPNRGPEQFHVTPLGYDATRFNEQHFSAHHDPSLVTHRFHQPYLLYVGRLEKKKNVIGLIEAFEKVADRFRDLELVLVGAPGYGYREIHRAHASSRYCTRIHACGWVREQELPIVYARAAMTVLPSWYEGFGIPVLESMACGTPVVASSAGALPEVVGGAGLLVDPAAPADLAEAIRTLLEHEATSSALRARGRERVKQFSWRTCAEQTWDIMRTSAPAA